MNTELLREWLNLPPGDWPPDHYTLIGVEPGTITDADAIRIEELALERMERLRPHQLRQQDEVTEGMNRLALAMACLSDHNSRRAYDASIGLADETALDDDQLTLTETEETEEGTESEELIVLELVEEQPVDPVILEFSEDDPPPVVEEPIVLTMDELDIIDDDPAEILARAEEERRKQRRKIYGELAKLRATNRAWEQLRPYLADPEAPITARSDVQTFTKVLTDLRPLIEEIGEGIGDPGKPGYRVVLLVRQHLALQTFRSFLPSQRIALSEDWESGRLEFRRRKRLLREEARSLIRKSWWRRVGGPWTRRYIDAPGWVLIPVSVLALVIALWRS